MSVNWGAELWDQFDNLEKHTSWGIDFLEKYTKFVKERADIELQYAKQIRSLSKKYLPKRSKEDDNRYTWCAAFGATLQQLAELAAQREEVADKLSSHVAADLGRFTQELKAERKSHFQDGRRAQQHIENSWKQLESTKRRFERDSKEAERAQHMCDRMDVDNNVDAEKVATKHHTLCSLAVLAHDRRLLVTIAVVLAGHVCQKTQGIRHISCTSDSDKKHILDQ